MQELVGRLTALDPEASETLKVIAYFDALIVAGAGVDALLRGAAALSGAVAGAERRGRVVRRTPDGQAAPEPATAPRRPEREWAEGTVWLEREGKLHANDEMVVERLALAVDLLESRRHPVGDLEIVLDSNQPITERTAALARLRITPTAQVRVIATRPEKRQPPTPLSTLVPTRYGLLQASLCRTECDPPSTPAGIGPWVAADHAAQSWEEAVFALLVTAEDRPVMTAEDFGGLMILARAYDPEAPHDDVRAVARLDERSQHILQILVEAESMRAAATTLGMHHSTLQAKHEWLTAQLGYDPRTIGGRIRYGVAELLRRLTDPRALR